MLLFLRTLASAIPSSLSYGHRMRLPRLGHKRQKMRTLEGLYCSSFHNSFGFCNFTHINYKSLVIYTAINRAELPRGAVEPCTRPRLASSSLSGCFSKPPYVGPNLNGKLES
jgi:hypothetical protein